MKLCVWYVCFFKKKKKKTITSIVLVWLHIRGRQHTQRSNISHYTNSARYLEFTSSGLRVLDSHVKHKLKQPLNTKLKQHIFWIMYQTYISAWAHLFGCLNSKQHCWRWGTKRALNDQNIKKWPCLSKFNPSSLFVIYHVTSLLII